MEERPDIEEALSDVASAYRSQTQMMGEGARAHVEVATIYARSNEQVNDRVAAVRFQIHEKWAGVAIFALVLGFSAALLAIFYG